MATGGRGYRDRQCVFDTLDELHATSRIGVVIHGACSRVENGVTVLCGADRWADEWGRERGAVVIPCPADWDAHGRAAGPIRNAAMVREHAPDVVVAFPGGRGTADMVRQAERALITVVRAGAWS